MGRLLATPLLRPYFLATFLSGIGDYALLLAAGVWVRELTGSTSRAGLCMLCYTAGTLLSPLAGVLVDRVRRRPLVMTVNSVTAVAVLSLALVHRADQVALVYGVMAVYGVSTSVSTSATTALLPKLVPGELLGAANGLAQALSQGQRLVTPALGVGLLALYGGGAVAVLDAAGFAAGLVCWAFVTVEEEPPRSAAAHWRRDTAAGFAFLVRRPVLRQLTLAMTAGVFVMGFFETVGIAVATTGLHHSASWTGVIVTAMGVTGVVGGLGAGAVTARLGPGRLAGLGLAVTGGAALLLAVPLDAVVIAGALLFGLGLPFVIVGSMTATQANTPNEVLGRVAGAGAFLVTGGQTLGIAAGAALIARFSYRDLCCLAAAVLFLATLYLVTRPEQRRRPDPVPEPYDEPVPAG